MYWRALKEVVADKSFFGGLAKASQPVFRQGVLNFIFADRAVGVEWESQVIPFLGGYNE